MRLGAAGTVPHEVNLALPGARPNFVGKMLVTMLVTQKRKARICILTWCFVVEMMGFEPTTPTLRT